MLVYRGSKRKEILAKSFDTIPEFGNGKTVFTELSLKHFLHTLISENLLIEQLRGHNETGTTPYLVCGNKVELIKEVTSSFIGTKYNFSNHVRSVIYINF
jgi:hypothetical protein